MIGLLFSGYEAINLAAGHYFGGETVWSSELIPPSSACLSATGRMRRIRAKTEAGKRSR